MRTVGYYAFGAAACLLTGWVLGSGESSDTRLTFLSVGQGDCAVFQHNGSAILIDDGPSDFAARLIILPKLRKLGVSRIDTIFLSHPDKDHVAGTEEILQRYPEARLAVSSEFKNNAEMMRDVESWLPARIDWLPKQSTATFGQFTIDLYCPTASNDNDGSMIVRLKNGDAAADFSGDASAETEAVAAAYGDWSAEVMKAGHHGSRTSTSFIWLREVHPKYVVVSCGKGNSYGHPHAETLQRISDAQALPLRTDRDGDIQFVLRNGHFQLQNESAE